MSKTRIPSQVGTWLVFRDSAIGGQWVAEHSDWERGDIGGGESGPAYAGGPIHCTASTLAQVLIDLVEVEEESGNFDRFIARVEDSIGDLCPAADDVVEALLRLLGIAVADGVDRLVAKVDEAMRPADVKVHSNGAMSFAGKNGVDWFRFNALRSGLKLYLRTGMIPNRLWTRNAMLSMATDYTSVAYPKSRQGAQRALDALDAMTQAKAAALKVEEV